MAPALRPVAIAALALTLYAAVRATRDLTDFRVYETAAARARDAEELYRPDDGHFQFKYLPAFALVMVPFGLMPAEVAKAVWFVCSSACLLAFVSGAIRELPERRVGKTRLWWLTLLLMGRFFLRELSLGQTNALLGLLLLAAVSAVRRGQPVAAGIWVGVAVVVKPYALVLVPWLGGAIGLEAVAASVGTLAAGLLLPALAYGWHRNLAELAAWAHAVADTTAPNLLLSENVSLVGTWSKWLGAGSAASLLAVATGLALLGLVAVVWTGGRRVARPAYLEWALLLLFIPLLSPQGWDYVLLFGTPAVVCALDRWWGMPTSWRLSTGAALVAVVFPVRDVLGLAAAREAGSLAIAGVAAVVLAERVARLRERALA